MIATEQKLPSVSQGGKLKGLSAFSGAHHMKQKELKCGFLGLLSAMSAINSKYTFCFLPPAIDDK